MTIYYERYAPDIYEEWLFHHGIKGQKWGVRRFQNPDGTRTELGKKRYGTVDNFNKSRERGNASGSKRKGMTEGQKKALKVAAAAVVTGAAAYGAYKLGSKSGSVDKLVDAMRNSGVKSKDLAEAASTGDLKKMNQNLKAYKDKSGVSSDELKAAVERLKLEREFTSLYNELRHPKRAYAKDVAINAGKKAATTMLAGGILYGTKVALTGTANGRDAANYVTPRPKNK